MTTPAEVQRIAALQNPVLRNLEITHAYSLLAAETAARSGQGANWCTFATWASRQAGATIRGEDAIDFLSDRLLRDRELLHPLTSFGRWLLRRGLFDRTSKLGRIMGRLHTPFDAVELASDAVARGNRKVFEEIGYEFARFLESDDLEDFLLGLREGDPPDGQRLLRSAFTRYAQVVAEPDPTARAQLLLLANLEIGMHEQTRLQPEIAEALDAPYITEEELGRRLCPGRRPRVQRVVAKLAGPAQSKLAELARELITHSLMVLSVPGRILALGMNLDEPYPDALRTLVQPRPRDPDRPVRAGRPRARSQRRARLVELRPADALHRPPLPRLPRPARSLRRALHARAGRALPRRDDPRRGPLVAQVLPEEAQDPLPRVLG